MGRNYDPRILFVFNTFIGHKLLMANKILIKSFVGNVRDALIFPLLPLAIHRFHTPTPFGTINHV